MARSPFVTSFIAAAFLLILSPSARAQEFVRQKLLVHTFDSHGGNLGRRVGDAVESVINHGRGRDLSVVDRGEMLRQLQLSGFNPDSLLLESEMRAMARRYRADEYVTGRAIAAADRALRVDGQLVLTRDSTLKQPIAVGEQPNINAAAEAFGSEVLRARAQLIPVRRCENALRAGQAREAAAAALEGIRAYPRAAIARVCLLRAHFASAKPADTVLAVATALLAIDSTSISGWQAAAAAYDELGKRDSAGRAWAVAASLQKSDPDALGRIVMALMSGGNDSIAKPIITSAVAEHAEDQHLAGLQWRVLLATGDWANAVRVGEALRKSVPSYESQPDFFVRMATAYRNMHDPFRAIATAAEGVARHGSDPELYLLYTQLVMAESDTSLTRGLSRFPKNGKLLALDAQVRRRRGDMQGALEATRRAVAQDSTLTRGSLQLAQAYLDVSQPDSALAVVQAGLRSASDSALAAQFTLARGNALYKSANASKKREDFEVALRFLQLSERLTPSANAGFLVGSAAFGVAQLASTEAAHAKSCPLATLAEDKLVLAETQLARHGGVAPDAAKQFLDFAGQMHPYVAQQIKSFCGGTNPSTTPGSGGAVTPSRTPAGRSTPSARFAPLE